MLPAGERKELAVLALAGSATITDLASEHGVSRKFIYAQAGKARVALDEAFLPAAGHDEVLFQVPVSKTWLRRVIVALPLICHSSYRDRGRDIHYWVPPAQNRTGGIPAYGSHLGCLTAKRSRGHG